MPYNETAVGGGGLFVFNNRMILVFVALFVFNNRMILVVVALFVFNNRMILVLVALFVFNNRIFWGWWSYLCSIIG